MGEERRHHRRIPLDLSAELSGAAGRTLPCRILDYSLGGLSIEVNRPDDARFLEAGASFVISFFAVKDVGQQPDLIRLRVEVCRASDNFAGVRFEKKPGSASRAILERAAQQYREQEQPREVSTRLPAGESEGFIKALQETAEAHLIPLIEDCLGSLPDLLLNAAQNAKSNLDQARYYEAISTFNPMRDGIREGFGQRIRQNILMLGRKTPPQFGRNPEDSSRDELSLVDENEFEDWLALRVTAQRGEDYHQELLDLLNEGITLGVGVSLNHRNNPLAPALLTQTFHDQLGSLCSDEVLMKLFLAAFTRQVIQRLDDLYESLRQLLQQRGLLQQAEEARREAMRTAVRQREDRQVLVNESELRGGGGPGGGGPGGGGPGGGGPGGGGPGGGGPGGGGPGGGGPGGGGPGGGAPTQATPPTPGGGFSALRNVLGATQTAHPTGEQAPVDAQGIPAGAPGQELDMGQLNDLLGKLQRPADADSRPGGRISDLLVQALSENEEGPARLSMEQQESVDLVENLVAGLVENPNDQEQVSEWLQQLQVPMLRLLLNDREFVNHQHHPARQVINQIVRLGGDTSTKNSGLNRTLQHFVDRIVQEYDGDNTVFDNTLDELNKIVERRNQAFLRNLERIQTAQEGHQRLLDARNQVAQSLRRMTHRQPVAGVIKAMIEEGWRDLMVTTIVRDGGDSPGYHQQCAVLEQLLELVPPGKPPARFPARDVEAEESEALLEQVKQGLELATADGFLVQSVHDDLRALLRGQAEKLDPERVAYEPLSEEVLQIEKSSLSGAPDEDFTLSARHRLRRLRSMQPGDGILMNPDSPERSRIRLAWKAADSSRMVFVDDRGLNPQEHSMDALLDQLHDGRVQFQLDDDLPPIDKSILKTIQSTYDTLVRESALDPLTGACTRKDFMRKLEDAVHDARTGSVDRILFYLDVDRFKVINSDAGHDAGDALVARIAETARQSVPQSESMGRMGGDELALLLKDLSTEQAVEAAERLRAAVETMRFEWEGKVFQPTVSIGVVEVHHGIEDVNAIMRIADSACFAAKSSGRNRVHLYISTDTLSSRQTTMMSWVSRINRCLEEDRLEIRLQPITPIREEDAHHHHEVLLAVMDEDGQPGSPFEFIQAAEAYGRIQAVDQWVVQKMLGWMRDHPEQHGKVGGVAINLSGASVGDDRFLEFLLAEIRNSGVDPARLGFEVTETVTVGSLEAASEFIAEVRAAGCPFALDDFGSGMSSFAYLRTMPVDYLKIDGVFIKDIVENASDYAMVKSINEIGHFLGKKTIAEYVESKEILAKLQEIGIDYAQGWCVSKPIPLSAF